MTYKTALAAVVLTALATTAQAHTKADKNQPTDGATVTDVPEITLAFDDPMRVISIVLKRDADEVAVDRETGMDPVTAFRVTPAEPLTPGAYAVEWRGMGADGHPMQGGFAFTVAE